MGQPDWEPQLRSASYPEENLENSDKLENTGEETGEETNTYSNYRGNRVPTD